MTLRRAARAAAALLVSAALAAGPLPAAAQEGDFAVSRIRLEGLVNVEDSTVLAFVGFERGDTVDDEVLASTVSRLFETGLFRDIEILRDGDEVVISLVENPTISSIRFDGMFNLDDERVLELLDSQDIAPGRIFRRGNSEYIERVILDFYRQNSRFLASVEVITAPEPGNQVGLVVAVSEGPPAVVTEINFHGNEVFSDSELKDAFEIKETGLINSLFDNDVFTREGFDGDLDRLLRLYLNDGHVRFVILSSDVRVDPDAGGIVIDIFVSEGAQYRFSEPVIDLGDADITMEQARAAATYAAGEPFSDRDVNGYRDALRRLMRQEGHAFAAVEAETVINDDTLEVEVDYTLIPDEVAEVNRIRFVGNNLTRDIVLRRQMELVEGETFALDKLEYSLTRLRRSGYLREARATERRVGDDKVDVDVEVQEEGSGNFVIGAGYSSSSGLSFKIDFSRNNIFGSGNDLHLSLGFEDDDRELLFRLEEPGITDSGIKRDFSLFYNSELAEGSGVPEDIDNYGTALTYTVPIDREWSWDFGGVVELSRIENSAGLINTPSEPFDDMSREFIEQVGPRQQAIRFVAGLGYDSRDRAFDTTEGGRFSVRTETTVPPSDIKYFVTSLNSEYFRPLDEQRRNVLYMRLQGRYGDDYGDGIFPYYKRFYISSGNLRGFDADKIGPQGNNVSIGGQMTMNANVEVERKVRLFGTEGVRLGAFLDTAGLWHDFEHFSDETGDFRSSAGVLVKIRTPVFPIAISYAVPLRKQDGDELEQFQFRIGF